MTVITPFPELLDFSIYIESSNKFYLLCFISLGNEFTKFTPVDPYNILLSFFLTYNNVKMQYFTCPGRYPMSLMDLVLPQSYSSVRRYYIHITGLKRSRNGPKVTVSKGWNPESPILL